MKNSAKQGIFSRFVRIFDSLSGSGLKSRSVSWPLYEKFMVVRVAPDYGAVDGLLKIYFQYRN